MEYLPKRVAIVYDWVDKWGGAEQILLALHDIFPNAPLYTLFYKPTKAPWAEVFNIKTSFLQKISFLPRQILIAFAPIAFESLTLSNFDLVVSVTSHFAKGIITSPNTKHFCICLTPPRYLYLDQINYKTSFLLRPFEKIVKKYLIYWDQIAARRPDNLFAISKTVQKRIKNIYHLSSEILYPPVKVANYLPIPKQDFFLYLGRLEAYKNPLLIVKVFNYLKLPLVIAGTGSLYTAIKKMAKPNIRVLGYVSESEKWNLYQQAKALIFYHEEDFGIVPVEALSQGTPVIGINKGGVSETVIHGKTGHLLDEISLNSLANAIINLHPDTLIASDLVSQAKKFSYDRFIKSFIRTCTLWR